MEVDEGIVPAFNEMKLRSTHKWITFQIVDKKIITIDEVGDPCPTESKEEDKRQFDALKAKMVTEEPRYIVYDFGFTGKEGRKINKLAFVFW